MSEPPRVSGNTKLFIVAGLLVGLGLALLVSPFASSSPDGLEKVAEEEGFSDSAADHHLAESPLAEYAVEGIGDDRLSTGASGVVGVLLTFGIGIGVFAAVRALRPETTGDDDRSGPGSRPDDDRASV